MKPRNSLELPLALVLALFAQRVAGAELQFRHHFLEHSLRLTTELVGDYGLTTLADLDRDADLDFVLGGRGVKPPRLYWFEFQAPHRWVQHTVGSNYLSDVGLTGMALR